MPEFTIKISGCLGTWIAGDDILNPKSSHPKQAPNPKQQTNGYLGCADSGSELQLGFC